MKNKNYYVFRKAGCTCSRYTLKLSLIFLNESMNQLIKLKTLRKIFQKLQRINWKLSRWLHKQSITTTQNIFLLGPQTACTNIECKKFELRAEIKWNFCLWSTAPRTMSATCQPHCKLCWLHQKPCRPNHLMSQLYPALCWPQHTRGPKLS